MLDHEGLDVYQLSLDFLVIANTVIEGFPRGRSHLADQFTRDSTFFGHGNGHGHAYGPDNSGTGPSASAFIGHEASTVRFEHGGRTLAVASIFRDVANLLAEVAMEAAAR